MLADPATADPPAAAATLQILFFGEVADRFGHQTELRIPTEGCRFSDIRCALAAHGPECAAALGKVGVRAAVAKALFVGDPWVRPADEVAFFSAFSGG